MNSYNNIRLSIFNVSMFYSTVNKLAEHLEAQWLRHYATNWKVAGSIADEVIF
jgi:hypothetical protein